MQLDNDLTYCRPKLVHMEKHKELLPGVLRNVTVITEDTLLDKDLKIPMRAQIHPLGLRELVRLEQAKGSKLVAVATILITKLQSAKQENHVSISYEEIAKLSSISERTIAKAMPILEQAQYIERAGKQIYKISARLAWFGKQVDWAVELKRLSDLHLFCIEDYIMAIEPIEENMLEIKSTIEVKQLGETL